MRFKRGTPCFFNSGGSADHSGEAEGGPSLRGPVLWMAFDELLVVFDCVGEWLGPVAPL